MTTLVSFLQRRQTLLRKMVSSSAALIFAAPETLRNADNHYPYRQNSNFWYLTGFNEPEAVLVLMKKADGQSQSILFNRERDKTAEIWNGRRLGQQAAPDTLGVDHALPYNDIHQQLFLLLSGLDVIYHALGEHSAADNMVFDALNKLRCGVKQNLQAPTTLVDWRPWVHEMRLFKSAAEMTILRQAASINMLAHTRAMQQCQPGIYEYQLEGEIHHEFTRHGARFTAYNTIVGGGENGCILHYTDNASPLRDGDLVLIDAGCELHGYASDITRTFPVNGKFSAPQRAIYDIVLSGLNRALTLFAPGISMRDAHNEVVHIMVSGLVKLGIMKGDVKQLIADKTYCQFFMHNLGHWLGLDVHDVGDYGGVKRDRPVQPGMVLTIEPGLYIAPDADVPAEYRGIGIRIEDNIVITEQGNENLTANVMKDVDEIEALMATAKTA